MNYAPYPYPPPIPPPPPPTGLAAVPTVVWVGAGGVLIFVFFKSGIFALAGQVMSTAGDLLGTTGKAAGDIVGSTGNLATRIIDRTGDSVIDPIAGGIGKGINGIVGFVDKAFSNRNVFSGKPSLIPIPPLSWVI